MKEEVRGWIERVNGSGWAGRLKGVRKVSYGSECILWKEEQQ